MQVWRSDFFARSLREQFKLGIKKEPRFAALFLRVVQRVRATSPLCRPQRRPRRGWAGDAHRNRHLNVVPYVERRRGSFDDEPEAFSNINTREEVQTWENTPPAW